MQVDDVLKLYVSNNAGATVSLSELVTPVMETSPLQFVRSNGYPAMRIAGKGCTRDSQRRRDDGNGKTSLKLSPGFTVEWIGQSLHESNLPRRRQSCLLSMLVVFLVLAALYGSWSIPFSVTLVVSLGIIGSVLAAHLRGLENDVFFTIGFTTIIGFSAKNSILIVEFAKNLRSQGVGLRTPSSEQPGFDCVRSK
ncbi:MULTISPECIES: efflux RND transporter permease subunit [unclassified Bradyrhizobium]|uniref:efflux RND transporter permease subunit n=1 Tax=Bradyrhizobium sp. IC3195 TaxID=2793804 RepID=UPI00201BA1C4|nr:MULTISPECIES: efflux RND transporter permease subunit [unclassified Bradyrhizobium]